MSGKKGGKTHHKPYKGPWPENHPSIPGREAHPSAVHGRGDLSHAPHQSPVQKVPPQAPK